MKIFLLILSLLTITLPAMAASRISALITITNTPNTNFSITLNGDTRYWGTNLSVTNIIVTNTIQASATNLYRHVAGYLFSGPVVVSQPATNTVNIIGTIDQAMAVSFASNWATVSYTTQAVGSLMAVRVPISSEFAATNRTNIASHLVKGINDYASNSFDGIALALTNFIGRTNHQFVSGNITFYGANQLTNAPMLYNATVTNGTLVQVTIDTTSNITARATLLSAASRMTNALLVDGGITNRMPNLLGSLTTSNFFVLSNAGILNLTMTNGINVGSSLQSYTDYDTSLQMGFETRAYTNGTTAIGYHAVASNAYATSIGYGSRTHGISSVAIGNVAVVDLGADEAIAIGHAAVASNDFSIAIGASSKAAILGFALGKSANAAYSTSMAIGATAETTAANQIRFGTATEGVSFPGNAYFAGALGVGADWLVALPTSFAGGIAMTNGTSATANPTNGVVFNAASGEWIYRASKSNEGAGQNNRVHNYGAETNGSGLDYTLTSSTALVDFGGVDPDITLPSAGTYLIQAIVTATAGGTANDTYVFKLYNQTGAADVANSQKSISAAAASVKFQLTLSSIVTVTAGDRIQLYGHNSTAARGTVNSTETKITYVRLF